jgi:hypothetical protein
MHKAMKTYGLVEVELHAFLTSALDGGEKSASGPSRFTPKESAPGTHYIRGWVGLRTGMDDAVAKSKNNYPLPRIEPRSSNP